MSDISGETQKGKMLEVEQVKSLLLYLHNRHGEIDNYPAFIDLNQ